MSNRKIIFTRAWRTYSVGQIIEPFGVLRQQLIESGFATPYEAPTPVVECAAAPPADFAPATEAEPSATGAPTAVLDRPQQTRKKHGR